MFTRKELMDKEKEILERRNEEARRELQEWIQARSGTVPAADRQGVPLTHRERIPMKIRSVFGSFSVTAVSGYSEQDGETLTPLRERLFGGARGILTPLLERNIAHLGLECGSFEKAARLCADWGVAVSDDKVMDTVRSVGTLDYYHAMEHLGEVAAQLFPDRSEREQWLQAMRAEIKEKGGPKTEMRPPGLTLARASG